MHHFWTFNFPAVKDLETDLEKILTQNQKELSIFLSYSFKKEGAVAENVMLKSEIEFESKISGSFVLEFDLVHFNACLAIHENVREEMKITFSIDALNQKLNLTGPSWPSREMDEI